MPTNSLDGDCIVRRETQPEPPRELLRAIDQLGVKARTLNEKHDRIVDAVTALRGRLPDAEDKLDQPPVVCAVPQKSLSRPRTSPCH